MLVHQRVNPIMLKGVLLKWQEVVVGPYSSLLCSITRPKDAKRCSSERIPTVNQLRISGTGRRVGSWPSWCCSSFFSDPWPSWTCSWVCWWRRHLGSQGGPLTNLGKEPGNNIEQLNPFCVISGTMFRLFWGWKTVDSSSFAFGHVHFFPVKFVSLLPPFSDGPIMANPDDRRQSRQCPRSNVNSWKWTLPKSACGKWSIKAADGQRGGDNEWGTGCC